VNELCGLWKTSFYVEEGSPSEEAEIMKAFAFSFSFLSHLLWEVGFVYISKFLIFSSRVSIFRRPLHSNFNGKIVYELSNSGQNFSSSSRLCEDWDRVASIFDWTCYT
jgi:hypothetical protein